MSGIEQAANDLFFKLRNRFPRINMGDEGGNTTTNPTDSRFFNFDYEEDDVKFGNITASLIDNQNLKLYFSQDVTKYMDREEKVRWYKFLQEIRKFAKAHMLGLDVRDIAKDVLSQKDLQFVSNQNREKTQIGESRVLWARRGKVSEGAVGNVKVHVFHSERMDENPHNRLLRVDRIFLVNESGERFLLPFKNVMGAKAMANHVGRGGNPYDATGKLIGSAITEMTNLRRFASATRRKTFESEDANQVIEAAQAIKESIKRSLFRLANNSRFDENIADLGNLLAEQDDVEDIKHYFMQNTYNENLDNWIGSAAKAFKQYKGNIMENLRESAGTVAQKLSDPQWKLVLKDEPAEDRLIASSKYSDGRALLRRILGTIADRVSMEDSDLANWASQIGQDMEQGAASNEDMQIALHLAKRYQTDLAQIAKSPEYGKEVRVSAFGQRKDLYGKAKDESMEFEDYVDSIGEEDYEMEEDGPVYVQDPRNPLPPLTAVERLQQKLGIGAFTPPKPGPAPINTEPLPGSPGAGQDDREALTRMIDNEGAEEVEEDDQDDARREAARQYILNKAQQGEIKFSGIPKYTGVDPWASSPAPIRDPRVADPRSLARFDRESAAMSAATDDRADRESAARIQQYQQNMGVAPVSAPNPDSGMMSPTRVKDQLVKSLESETNEAINTMLWLAGVKKKSDVSEAAPDWDANVGFDDWFKANGPSTPKAADSTAAPKVELPKAGPDVAPKVELPKGPASAAPEVELTKPKFNFSPIDNKFTQLPDKGFSPAPTIEPPTTGFSGTSDAPKITQNNVTREPPRTTRIAPPTIEPPTKTPSVQTGVAPEINVSNGDRLPTPEPAPNYVGNFVKALAPRLAGGVIANVLDPKFLGGQQAPSKADDEMSPQKGFALSQPSGTITNPERGFNQSNNMQQPAQYSPDMVSTDRIRDLAGIGRK